MQNQSSKRCQMTSVSTVTQTIMKIPSGALPLERATFLKSSEVLTYMNVRKHLLF